MIEWIENLELGFSLGVSTWNLPPGEAGVESSPNMSVGANQLNFIEMLDVLCIGLLSAFRCNLVLVHLIDAHTSFLG